MNAAAKAISETKLFTGHLSEMRLSKQTLMSLLLIFSILATALAVVYDINNYRISLSQLEQLEEQKQHLQIEWSRLLLEQASLSTPERVGQMASQKLNMRIPVDKHTFVLRHQ